MKKYTQSEGQLEVLTGRQANVLNEAFRRTGKYTVDAMSDEDRAILDNSLEQARKQDEEEAKAQELQDKPAAPKAAKPAVAPKEPAVEDSTKE